MLNAQKYIDLRYTPLEASLRDKAHELALRLRILRICVIVSTFASTLCGVLELNAWIPICISLGASFQGWIDFQSLPGRLANLNIALNTLNNELLWFRSLDFVQRGTLANFSHLVDVVEGCANAEASAIVQSTAQKERPKEGDKEGEETMGENGKSKKNEKSEKKGNGYS